MKIKSFISLLIISAVFLVSCGGDVIVIGTTPSPEDTTAKQTAATPTGTKTVFPTTTIPGTVTPKPTSDTHTPDTTVLTTETPVISETPSETPVVEPLPWNPDKDKTIKLTADGMFELRNPKILSCYYYRPRYLYYNTMRNRSRFCEKLTFYPLPIISHFMREEIILLLRQCLPESTTITRAQCSIYYNNAY